jgi:hypothetical protein
MLVQRSLGEGLALTAADGVYARCRDAVTGLEHVRSSRELCERGFPIGLRAYECHVLLDFHEVHDSAHQPWAQLERELGGRGASSLDDALDEIRRRALTMPFAALLGADTLGALAAAGAGGNGSGLGARLDEVESRARAFLDAAATASLGRGDTAALARGMRTRIEAALARATTASSAVPAPDPVASRTWAMLVAFEALRTLGALSGGDPSAAARLGREWRLERGLASALEAAGVDAAASHRGAQLAFELLIHVPWFAEAERRRLAPDRVFAHWLGDDAVRRLLDVHTHADVEWFRQESFEEWIAFLAVAAAGLEPAGAGPKRGSRKNVAAKPAASKPPDAWLVTLLTHARASGWRTDRMLAADAATIAPSRPARRRASRRTPTAKSRTRR